MKPLCGCCPYELFLFSNSLKNTQGNYRHEGPFQDLSFSWGGGKMVG